MAIFDFSCSKSDTYSRHSQGEMRLPNAHNAKVWNVSNYRVLSEATISEATTPQVLDLDTQVASRSRANE